MKHNTIVLVVDFAKKRLLAREELTHSASKKEKEKLDKLTTIIGKLSAGEEIPAITQYGEKVVLEKAS